MLVKINDKAYGNLKKLRGQWVEVDTSHVFNNQYNLKNYDMRVFDKDVEAIKNDVRRGMVQCGYCGAQFKSIEDLKEHYAEERAKAHKNCDSCFWYQAHIINTECTNTKQEQKNGDILEVRTTAYTWRKQCTHQKNDNTRTVCTHLEHESIKPFYFTEDNTYFLKYPNGYGAYFEGLTTAQKWQELKYIYDDEAKTATKRGAMGTYDAIHYFNEDGSAKKIIFKNSRKQFEISGEDFKRILKNHFTVAYLLTYNDDETKKAKSIFEDMPQCLKNNIEIYFNQIRTYADKYGKKYYQNLYGVEV